MKDQLKLWTGKISNTINKFLSNMLLKLAITLR